jgi:large subunit ribosomal protein L24
MHVRKGDTVLVIAGNDKGKQGVVRSVDLERNRVVVEGVNLRWKHQKATQKNPKGERTQREFMIHASNVMHFDAKTQKGTRRRPERASKSAQASKAAAPKATTAAKAAKAPAKKTSAKS